MDPVAPQDGASVGAGDGALVAELSREFVKLYVNFYGRGPTKARSYLHADYGVCVLEEVFTTAERTLIDNGSADYVRSGRRRFHDALQAEFIAVVERVTGRRVRVLLGQIDIEANLTLLTFLFI